LRLRLKLLDKSRRFAILAPDVGRHPTRKDFAGGFGSNRWRLVRNNDDLKSFTELGSRLAAAKRRTGLVLREHLWVVPRRLGLGALPANYCGRTTDHVPKQHPDTQSSACRVFYFYLFTSPRTCCGLW